MLCEYNTWMDAVTGRREMNPIHAGKLLAELLFMAGIAALFMGLIDSLNRRR